MIPNELILKFESLPQTIQRRLVEEIDLLFARYSAQSKVQKSKKKYDFTDLTGKLQWRGNAVAAQKQLRNEWQ